MGNIFTTILVQPLTNGLILFYTYLGKNLGVAIIVFSLVLIFLLRPLTKPYLESMKKIKLLEPQLAKLRKKYGDDKMRLSQAQAELYKQNKINPTAGCLPYILQFLVLIALFRVFTTALSSQEIATGNINQLLYPFLKFGEGEVLNTKFLYMDISKPDTFQIPGIGFGFPGLFLILASPGQNFFFLQKVNFPHFKPGFPVACDAQL